MSKQQILDTIHELDGMGIVVTDNDESLAEAIDELGLADSE